MAKDSVTVEMSLLENLYRFSCSPDEQDFLEHAGDLLQERYRDMRREHPQMERQKIAVMVGLQLMQELVGFNVTLQEYAHSQRIVRSMLTELEETYAEQLENK